MIRARLRCLEGTNRSGPSRGLHVGESGFRGQRSTRCHGTGSAHHSPPRLGRRRGRPGGARIVRSSRLDGNAPSARRRQQPRSFRMTPLPGCPPEAACASRLATGRDAAGISPSAPPAGTHAANIARARRLFRTGVDRAALVAWAPRGVHPSQMSWSACPTPCH